MSTDFDFEFSRSLGRGASIVEMRQNLTAFTVAFWLKVANTEIDPGTPLSYATEVGGNIISLESRSIVCKVPNAGYMHASNAISN